MAAQAKEIHVLFKNAQQVVGLSGIHRLVTEVRQVSKLAEVMRETAEGIANNLVVSASIDNNGGTKRKFEGPNQSTVQPDAKVRKTDNMTSASNVTPSAAGTTAKPSEAKPKQTGSSTSATVSKTTKTVPAENGNGSSDQGDDGDAWTCASCTFLNHPAIDECEICASPRYAFEVLKIQLEEMQNRMSLVEPPSHWLPAEPGTRVQRVKLAEADKDYVMISEIMSKCCSSSTTFTATSLSVFGLSQPKPRFRIKKIERIENVHLYQMYSIKRSQLDEENPVTRNEKMLWHGTAPECINNIASYGFNRSHCGKNGTRLGKGVYFGAGPGYSAKPEFATPDAHGVQHMFYCRVLTGRFTIGDETMVEPPMLKNKLGRFNSLADDVLHPSMFVIFHDAQAYPEFLISFTANDG